MLETLVKTYLVAPFFASILVALFKFIKPLNNPIIIRRFTDIFFFIMFVLAFFTTVACDKVIYSFLGFDIYFDKFVAYALFLVGFIFLLFSFYSKAYVLKRRKIFFLIQKNSLPKRNILLF